MLVLLGPLFAAEEKPVTLEPFKVHGTAQSSFGIDVRIYMDSEAKRVESIFITRIVKGSDAAHLELQVGDQIMKVDGALVKGMDAKVNYKSELGRILLNRKSGDRLDLELAVKRPKNLTMHWPWQSGKIFVSADVSDGVSIIVKHIAVDSEAKSLGLRPGDEIVRINRIALNDLKPESDITRQIGQILLNLPPEDIQLRVLTKRAEEVLVRHQHLSGHVELDHGLRLADRLDLAGEIRGP